MAERAHATPLGRFVSWDIVGVEPRLVGIGPVAAMAQALARGNLSQNQIDPPGASGARLLTHLLYELRRRRARYGLGAACIGGGQGIAVVVESLL